MTLPPAPSAAGDIGVIHVGLLNIIRRMALREKLPIREIARRTGMSRNTIKKYLNAGTIEPQFATPERQSKLDPFSEKLAGWLKTEAARSRKQRRTLGYRARCLPSGARPTILEYWTAGQLPSRQLRSPPMFDLNAEGHCRRQRPGPGSASKSRCPTGGGSAWGRRSTRSC